MINPVFVFPAWLALLLFLSGLALLLLLIAAVVLLFSQRLRRAYGRHKRWALPLTVLTILQALPLIALLATASIKENRQQQRDSEQDGFGQALDQDGNRAYAQHTTRE